MMSSYAKLAVWFGEAAWSWLLYWFILLCVMTPGLSKDIRCHVV